MIYTLLLVIISCLGWAYWSVIPFGSSDVAVQNTSSGLISYGKETIESLKANGLVSLDGTTVKNGLEVNGSLKAQNATVGSLLCNGHTSVTDVVIKGKSEVFGFLNATRTQFQGELVLGAQSVTFVDASLGSILVKSPPWIIGSQVITLSGKTAVKGTITFESGKGIVKVLGDSKVSGKIIGAERSS